MGLRAARWSLLVAGASSAGIAVLHVCIALVGPTAYTYFGAADLAPSARAGSPVPAVITIGLAIVFGLWAWYAFGGARIARKPPLLTIGIWVIGAIYVLRGAMLLPELLSLGRGGGTPPRFAMFSFVSLATGIAYLLGALGLRRQRSDDRGFGGRVSTR